LPASERDTALWARHVSGLEELLGADFGNLSNNALYRVSDRIYANHDVIEEKLSKHEKEPYGLGEKIILYDLTNTYLTGAAPESSEARRAKSKEKRSDCPLITLGLVLDEDGFPKASKMFAGNVSEPSTLKGMLDALRVDAQKQLCLFSKPATVVMDAGVATEENLELIRKEGLHYLCVSRSRPDERPEGDLQIIKEDKSSKVSAKKLEGEGEVLLYCESSGRARKNEKDQRIHIRQTTDPEPFHFDIYQALGMHPKPLKATYVKM
jgi:transposase